MILDYESKWVPVKCGSEVIAKITLGEAFELECGDTFQKKYIVTSEIYFGQRHWVYLGFDYDRPYVLVEEKQVEHEPTS